MAKKKKAVICVCVEGDTEKTALSEAIQDLFDARFGNDVVVDFRSAITGRHEKAQKYDKESEPEDETQGDITTIKSVNVENVVQTLYKHYFKLQDKNHSLRWNDFTYVIHILDLDGAFINKEKILPFTEEEATLARSLSYKEKERNVLYFDDHIAVKPGTVELIQDRNHRKSKILSYLMELESITYGRKTVGYTLYYFSSNLDHYLGGNANLSKFDKNRLATDFRDMNAETEDFLSFFQNSPHSSTSDSYDGSWQEAIADENSLKRGTNVNRLLTRILESELEDWLAP